MIMLLSKIQGSFVFYLLVLVCLIIMFSHFKSKGNEFNLKLDKIIYRTPYHRRGSFRYLR